MVFKVTTNCNLSLVGDVFYTVPATEELKKAEKLIAEFCNEGVEKIYKIAPEIKKVVLERLNYELRKMHTTKTAYQFLILKEIKELSQEEGYPIIIHSNLSCSVISFLLGISEFDPFKYYVPEFLWGTETKPVTPDFTIGIAPQVRPLIHRRLDEKYGFVECNNEIFKKISIVDVNTCKHLGALAQATGKRPSICDLNNAIYLRAAKSITDEFLEDNRSSNPLVKYMVQIENCNFDSLLRLYAFTTVGFINENSIQNLNGSNFFVTSEEFFNSLMQHNVPADIALDIVKNGISATGVKRDKYVEILESYHVSESVKNYFEKVTHLWTKASCVGRVLHKCYIAWYQEYYPEEINRLNK